MALNKGYVWLLMWITLVTAQRPGGNQGKAFLHCLHNSQVYFTEESHSSSEMLSFEEKNKTSVFVHVGCFINIFTVCIFYIKLLGQCKSSNVYSYEYPRTQICAIECRLLEAFIKTGLPVDLT